MYDRFMIRNKIRDKLKNFKYFFKIDEIFVVFYL